MNDNTGSIKKKTVVKKSKLKDPNHLTNKYCVCKLLLKAYQCTGLFVSCFKRCIASVETYVLGAESMTVTDRVRKLEKFFYIGLSLKRDRDG